MRLRLIGASAALLAVSSLGVLAQGLETAIVGTWKYRTAYIQETGTGKISYPWGQQPTGYIVYTKSGHTVFFLAGDNRKPQAGNAATDAERIALFNSLAGGSGRYKIEGNSIIITYDASWNQTWTGTTQRRELTITGNELTIKAPPAKNTAGNEVVFEIKLDRVE